MIGVVAYAAAITVAVLSVLIFEGVSSWSTFETRCPPMDLIPEACKDRLRDLIDFQVFNFVPVTIVTVLTTFVPSIVIVLIFKRLRIKAIAAFLFAGFAIAGLSCFLFVAFLYNFMPSDEGPQRPFLEAYLMLAKIVLPSGVIGAFAYWLVVVSAEWQRLRRLSSDK